MGTLWGYENVLSNMQIINITKLTRKKNKENILSTSRLWQWPPQCTHLSKCLTFTPKIGEFYSL